MRNIIITLLLFLSSLAVCKGQDKPIPERLEGVKEAVFYLDSAARSLEGWHPTDSSSIDDIHAAEETWTKFKQLCENDEYEKALDFYLETDADSQKKHFGDFFIFLKHTTNQYIFASDVLKPLLFEYCDEEVAYEEYIMLLEFEKAMGDAMISINEDGNGYVPETFAYVIRDLGYALAATGRAEEAMGLLDDFAFGVSQIVDSPLKVNFSIAVYMASVAMIDGDLEEAIQTWEDFKAYHLTHGDEYDPDELDACLQQADDEISDIKSYMYADV